MRFKPRPGRPLRRSRSIWQTPGSSTTRTRGSARLREAAAVNHEVFDRWLVTRHADVRACRRPGTGGRELDPVIEAEQYCGGKQGLLDLFVGQVTKETGGAAGPRMVSERLREKLAG